MPHVVVVGDIDLSKVHAGIQPIMDRSGSRVLKTDAVYIDREATRVLVECLSIEDSEKAQFMALISKRDDGVVVRLHPWTDVAKTDGVKRLLALLGAQVRALDPSYSFGETNLDDHLPDE